ncbi:MAG: secretin N-terminal domain-containing protein [Candidatus Omnitrophica bacterium]|nr:secretin N-terminal domain-containing protein [Candidatus Omnitrophota bacterium]
MKTAKPMWIIAASFFILYLAPPLYASGQELPFEKPDATITMDFQDARLKDILKIFSIQSGLSFIAAEDIEDKLMSLYLDRVSIKDAMDKIFKANNLEYEFDRDSSIFIVRNSGRSPVLTVTKVFRLKYGTVTSANMTRERKIIKKFVEPTLADTQQSGGGDEGDEAKGAAEVASGIVASVAAMLTQYGKITEDSATNSIIVTDVPANMPVIEKLIAALDVSRAQIIMDVEMIDVSKDIVDNLGIQYGSSPFTLILPGGFMRRGARFFIGDVAYKGATSITSATAGALVLGDSYGEVINFLRTQTDAKFLARPRILTLDNETAEIKIATNEAVGLKTTTTSAEGSASTSIEAERAETGVSLRVTPQVNSETGEITMLIVPSVSEAKTGGTFGSTTFKDPEIRITKSIVRVNDGDTVVLGGLIRNELSEVNTKLPLLGDIPVLGALFRHKNKSKDKERELLVFITPRIIKNDAKMFAQINAKYPAPNREQKNASAFDRQRRITGALNEIEKEGK